MTLDTNQLFLSASGYARDMSRLRGSLRLSITSLALIEGSLLEMAERIQDKNKLKDALTFNAEHLRRVINHLHQDVDDLDYKESRAEYMNKRNERWEAKGNE